MVTLDPLVIWAVVITLLVGGLVGYAIGKKSG